MKLNLKTSEGYDACVFCGACCKSAHCAYGKPVNKSQLANTDDLGSAAHSRQSTPETHKKPIQKPSPLTINSCAYIVKSGELDGIPLLTCSIADEISKQPGSDYMPAFGAGCCRNMFNQDRDEIVKKTIDDSIPEWKRDP